MSSTSTSVEPRWFSRPGLYIGMILVLVVAGQVADSGIRWWFDLPILLGGSLVLVRSICYQRVDVDSRGIRVHVLGRAATVPWGEIETFSCGARRMSMPMAQLRNGTKMSLLEWPADGERVVGQLRDLQRHASAPPERGAP